MHDDKIRYINLLEILQKMYKLKFRIISHEVGILLSTKRRFLKFMLGKLVDLVGWMGYHLSTKENDVMWIVGGLEVSKSILVR